MITANDIETGTGAESANVETARAPTPTSTSKPASVDPAAMQTALPLVTVTAITPATISPEADDTGIQTRTITTNLNNNLCSNGENNGSTAIAVTVETQAPPPEQQQLQTDTTKGKMDSDPALVNFKVLYVVAQLCGLTLVVLVSSWIGVHMGGLAGTSDPKLEFNWHPIMMTIGLIFFYGNSILVYRGFRMARKKTLKITHASIHMGAFVLTVIGLKTAFDSHNLAAVPIPNMYSLHSWLGLSAVLLFCLQYAAGFVAYLAPGLKESYKAVLMPWHVFFGLFGFVLAIACALMGLTEKAIFSIQNYSELPSSGILANMCGVMFLIFGGLVVYLATEPAYKRKPIPEDAVLLTGVSE